MTIRTFTWLSILFFMLHLAASVEMEGSEVSSYEEGDTDGDEVERPKGGKKGGGKKGKGKAPTGAPAAAGTTAAPAAAGTTAAPAPAGGGGGGGGKKGKGNKKMCTFQYPGNNLTCRTTMTKGCCASLNKGVQKGPACQNKFDKAQALACFKDMINCCKGPTAVAAKTSPVAEPTTPPVNFAAAWVEGANCSSSIGGLGTMAVLSEFGYLEVAEICCNFQMEFFITRVAISMGYKVCDQSGIMGMVPWFSCGDFQSLEKLKLAITAGSPEKSECPFVQWNNEVCQPLAPKCFPNTTRNEGYHRRRVCDQVGGYSGGGPMATPVTVSEKSDYATPAPTGDKTIKRPDGKDGGSFTSTINLPGYAGADWGGYKPNPSPAPPPKICAATFMNMGGTTVMNTLVQGETDYALDMACCTKCSKEEECTFWVRRSGIAPGTACYLRKKASGVSNSLSYRGGWRRELACGAKNGCFSSFDYMSGTIIEKVGICGKTPEELDQHCCEKCRKREGCEFWVRERGDSGYRACQLMKNPGSKSVNINYRGGWKQGCGTWGTCHATFLNRGGSLLDKLGVCGESHQVLDAACCELCSKNGDCEFWTRESGYSGSQFCWLYKNAAINEAHSSNRRGGWNKICNSGNGFDQCLASFQTINGATVAVTRVCGKDDAGLDTECCQKCRSNSICESWERDRGSRGFKTCWLKRASTRESNNANRRGGYTTKQACGEQYLNNGCRSSYYEWGGSQIGQIRYVCGKTAAELDAHCCALCRNETECDHWVREAIGSTSGEGANRPRACWLRRNIGGPSRNINRRGGFREGCGAKKTPCKQTFLDRGGAQIDRRAVCAGSNFKSKQKLAEYLDAACCDICAKTKDCEFWVRDRIPFTMAHGAPNTTYCWLRKNAARNPSNNVNRRGGWNRICGDPKGTACPASFQELHGHVVGTKRVCGRTDEQLDSECCSQCKQMSTCDFWVREKGSNGYMWCWLRRKGNGNKSPNANRRGGYKTPTVCGAAYTSNGCRATFNEMSGSQLKIEMVCGANDAELDAMCCALCRNDTRCEFWVRETRLITDPPSRPKICWLRWNAGSASKNNNRRGGWREGCDNRVQKCVSTFTDRSGPLIDKRGVCGNGTGGLGMQEYLDSACCDLCSKNKDCEFWVRETTLPAINNTFCYLRKHGSLTETVRTNKRGGWNKKCGNPNNPACGATFQEIHSSNMATFRVCGRTDAQLDAECCAKCKENTLCEKWVREIGSEGWRWCWLRRGGNNRRTANNNRRGGWKVPGSCGDKYVTNGCKSSFDHIGGSQVGYDFVCGKTAAELDAHCCAQCRNNTRCEFWVRQSGDSGTKQCWLRMNPGGHSRNAGYRGGWVQGCGVAGMKKCDATFTDWNGGEVNRLGVCGANDAQMDAQCCALCAKEPLCEFWVREDTEKVTEDRKNSALCWLRKDGSTERVATNRRGGWKACATDGMARDCTSTFKEMSGPQVARERVCGSDDAKLDSACCAKCDKNPACHLWVREAGSAGYRWCWLRRNPGGSSNSNSRRGGMKKQNFPECKGTFGDMSGPQVAAYTVWGETDDILDAACCDRCRKLSSCEFWVRDYRKTFPSNIGGKTCWLRRSPNFNSRSASHPYRRGGMKPTSLLQEGSETDDSADAGNVPDELAPDEADPVDDKEQELSLLQSGQGSTSSAQLWTVADATAEVNEQQEQQLLEVQAQAQAAAEAKALAEEKTAEHARVNEETKVAEEESQQAQKEQYFQDFNVDIPNRIHESGHRAAMDERGYKAVAALKDNSEMESYIRRAARFMGFVVKDDSNLAGLVPYYSGVTATQSFETLLLELERSAHDENAEKWIMPEGEEEAEDQAEEAVPTGEQ